MILMLLVWALHLDYHCFSFSDLSQQCKSALASEEGFVPCKMKLHYYSVSLYVCGQDNIYNRSDTSSLGTQQREQQ